MWRVKQISTRKVGLDFSSSGQGTRHVTQMVADGTILTNALELTDWSQRSVQLIVCSQCGTEHCEHGGWVSPRWTGSHVILLPDFARMADDQWALNDYRPPDYFGSRGIPVLPDVLAKTIPALPWPHELPLITGQELVHAIQWTAPWNIVGRFLDLARVRREDVIATSEPDLPSAIDRFERALARMASSADEILLDTRGDGALPVSFYLDDPGATEWVPGFSLGGEIALALDADLVAPPSGAVRRHGSEGKG